MHNRLIRGSFNTFILMPAVSLLINVQIPNDINEVAEPLVKQKLEELANQNHVLGFLLQGSRITGFGSPTTDWDIIIYCTDEFFSTLDYDTIGEQVVEEVDGAKRLIGDFAYFCDEIFQQQLSSPMDIDHVPYTISQVLLDKTGKLKDWVNRLAKFPEDFYHDKVKLQLVQLRVAFGYAKISKARERNIDLRVNLNRALTLSLTVWFTLHECWVPQLKWWSGHVKRLGMQDETFDRYQQALEHPSYENIEILVNLLLKIAEDKGIDINFKNDFYSTIMPHGRPKYIKASYF